MGPGRSQFSGLRMINPVVTQNETFLGLKMKNATHLRTKTIQLGKQPAAQSADYQPRHAERRVPNALPVAAQSLQRH